MSSQKPSKLVTPLRVLWVLVILLFVVNAWLLNRGAEGEGGEDGMSDGKIAEQMGWWESFRKGMTSKNSLGKTSVFDGSIIDPDTQEEAVMVMMDNSYAAHEQQYGIRQASIVYEVLVEGGITRLMLLYPYQDVEQVGPVRSARDYFVDIAEEYGGLYAHAGGSPTALEQLWASDNLGNMDEDDRESGDLYSFRDDQHAAPHNLYFDLIALRERAKQLGHELVEPGKNWCFDDSHSLEMLEKVKKIDLRFTADEAIDYQVRFTYDTKKKSYTRSRYGNGEQHRDLADGKTVSPNNLLVQIVPSQLIAGDEKERIQINLRGKGILHYFWKGRHAKGFWKNSGKKTEYFTADGSELCLPAGQTWVALLDHEDLMLMSED